MFDIEHLLIATVVVIAATAVAGIAVSVFNEWFLNDE